jgi:hypothetical protein
MGVGLVGSLQPGGEGRPEVAQGPVGCMVGVRTGTHGYVTWQGGQQDNPVVTTVSDGRAVAKRPQDTGCCRTSVCRG